MIKFIFGMQINIEVFYKLIFSFWVCVTRHSLQYLQRGMENDIDFYPQTNMTVSYKMIGSFWACLTRHAQSTQNNKFVISLQYLKEKVKDEVSFLPADKHQGFLQIDIILGVFGQACPNYPK